MAPLRFTYRIAPGVKVTLRLDRDALTYRQGLRETIIPLASVRKFAVRDRGESMGIVTSELMILVERPSGQRKVSRLPFHPRDGQAQAGLAALAERTPGADLRALPWEQVAAELGVEPYGATDRLMNPKAVGGALVVLASVIAGGLLLVMSPATSLAERLGQGIGVLGGVVVGIVLIVRGYAQGGRPREAGLQR